METRIIKRYTDPIEAQIDKNVLDDAEINSWLQDDNMLNLFPVFSNALGSIKLIVDRNDFELALRLLEDKECVIEDEYIKKCPKCNSKKLKEVYLFSWKRVFYGIFFFLTAPPSNFPSDMKIICTNCNHSWKEDNSKKDS